MDWCCSCGVAPVTKQRRAHPHGYFGPVREPCVAVPPRTVQLGDARFLHGCPWRNKRTRSSMYARWNHHKQTHPRGHGRTPRCGVLPRDQPALGKPINWPQYSSRAARFCVIALRLHIRRIAIATPGPLLALPICTMCRRLEQDHPQTTDLVLGNIAERAGQLIGQLALDISGLFGYYLRRR